MCIGLWWTQSTAKLNTAKDGVKTCFGYVVYMKLTVVYDSPIIVDVPDHIFL